jgi:uncharacterized protein (TIGR03437 family)
MALRGFVLSLLGLLGCATALDAQDLPCSGTLECAQGTAFSFDFGQGLDQVASLINSIAGISYSYNFALSGGTLPPGLTLSPSGLISGTLTTAGQFSFTLTFSETLSEDGQTVFNESVPIPFGLDVTGYSGPPVTIDPSGVSFSLTQNGPAATQSVSIANFGSQAVQFSASATTNSSGNWLTVSPSQGSVNSFGANALAITADPSQLAPGTYSGVITISVKDQTLGVSVLAVVGGTQPSIQLSQTGLRFQAVSGGTATAPQSITVLNPGAGTLTFSASASTISGGTWLSVSPATGTSVDKAGGTVTVSVNPTGLQPGDYYGTIQFSAPGVVNSPQVASVVLNVLSQADSPGAFVAPTGLIFVGRSGGTGPAAKTISVTNPSPVALTYLVTPFANNGSNSWLTVTPASGSVSATQPATVSVQPNLTGLAAGIYIGDLTVNIVPATDTSTTTPSTAPPQIFHIEILLVVLPAGSSPAIQSVSQTGFRPQAVGCTPTKLLPVFTQLGTGFTAEVAWPTAVEVTVVDDCGTPVVSGSVTALFTSGDPALALDSLNDGRWTATWNATHASTQVTITAQAQEVQPAITGSAQIGGTLEVNTATPSVSAGGVIGVFNSVANQPLAPGAYGAIYGSNLSEGLNQSNQYPFSLQLGDTSVLLGGKALPLYFASAGQINVVVPYDVPVNSTQQLVVQRGSSISIPQPVFIAPAQPTILTQSSAPTTAVINVYKSDGTALPNNSPVGPGYVITLYCSGLGAVDPAVAAGSPAPASPLSHTVNPVTVKIGQTQAQVLFAGLVPVYAQLYQVNVQIPSGLSSGDATLTLSVSGQQSAPVTIAVQ